MFFTTENEREVFGCEKRSDMKKVLLFLFLLVRLIGPGKINANGLTSYQNIESEITALSILFVCITFIFI